MLNRSSSRFTRTNRGAPPLRPRQQPRFMDSLEPRQLLAADLGIAFDDFGNVPQTLIPGDQISLPFIIRNVGDSAAVGTFRVDFLLSTDAVFDSGDVELRRFTGQPISLGADNSEELAATVDIPTIAPGNYFFLVRLVPGGNIGDVNQSNHVAASEDDQAFAWKFGSFDGRTNATLTLTDPSGTEVSFGMSGGGFGTVTADTTNTERFNVVLSGTGAASNFVIEADQETGEGDTAGHGLINDISGGAVNSITAPTARLFGDIMLTGTLGSLTFGNVVGPSVIRVQGSTVNTTYALGNVADLRIESSSPIASLSATQWTDTTVESAADIISAPWLGALTTTGGFQASLSLTGRSGGGRTLGSAVIGGNISKGSWRINGTSGAISARQTAADWSVSIVKALTTFTTTLDFRGVLAAKSLGTLTVGRDLRAAKVLLGANLGADARLGGIGANADTFSNGNITTVAVAGRAVNVIIGAGLDPVDGVFKNGNDQYRGGKIGRVTINGAVGSGNRFLAPRYTGTQILHGVSVNPATDARYMLS